MVSVLNLSRGYTAWHSENVINVSRLGFYILCCSSTELEPPLLRSEVVREIANFGVNYKKIIGKKYTTFPFKHSLLR